MKLRLIAGLLVWQVMYAALVFSQSDLEHGQKLGTIWNAMSDIPSTGRTNRKLAPLDDLLVEHLFKNQLPGATVAVTYKGRIIYRRGFGFAELGDKVPMQPDALMRIASVSKPVTGVAIMMLVDQGKLKLGDKVFEILDHKPIDNDSVDPRSYDITIRQLLNHTAGYDRNESYDPMFQDEHIARALGRANTQISSDDIVRFMLSQKLDFSPGERMAYSNYGYCLLGRVIEKLTGKPYETFVREEMLKPVGIDRMQIGKSLLKDRIDGEPRYYMREQTFRSTRVGEGIGKKQVPRQYGGYNVPNMDSHGAWVASAMDLVTFASELDRPRRCKWMKPDSMLKLFEMPNYLGIKKEKGKSTRYYAAGWSIVDFDKGINAYHSGALSGTSSMLVKRFDEVNWAILFNCRKTNDGKEAAGKLDSRMHGAVNAVKKNLRLK